MRSLNGRFSMTETSLMRRVPVKETIIGLSVKVDVPLNSPFVKASGQRLLHWMIGVWL